MRRSCRADRADELGALLEDAFKITLLVEREEVGGVEDICCRVRGVGRGPSVRPGPDEGTEGSPRERAAVHVTGK